MLQIDQETKAKLIALELGDREALKAFREPNFLREVAANAAKLKKSIDNFLTPGVNPRTRKIAENFIEKQIANAFQFHGDRIEFDMFAIPRIFTAVKKEIYDGGNISDAMQKAVEMYRIPERTTVH